MHYMIQIPEQKLKIIIIKKKKKTKNKAER